MEDDAYVPPPAMPEPAPESGGKRIAPDRRPNPLPVVPAGNEVVARRMPASGRRDEGPARRDDVVRADRGGPASAAEPGAPPRVEPGPGVPAQTHAIAPQAAAATGPTGDPRPSSATIRADAAVPRDLAGAGPEGARGPADQIVLHIEGETGFAGRVRIRALGGSLRASIQPATPEAARGLDRHVGELERALVDHGFTQVRVSVQAAPAVADASPAEASRAGARGETADPREGRRPPPDDPRDPGSRRSRRDHDPNETER